MASFALVYFFLPLLGGESIKNDQHQRRRERKYPKMSTTTAKTIKISIKEKGYPGENRIAGKVGGEVHWSETGVTMLVVVVREIEESEKSIWRWF